MVMLHSKLLNCHWVWAMAAMGMSGKISWIFETKIPIKKSISVKFPDTPDTFWLIYGCLWALDFGKAGHPQWFSRELSAVRKDVGQMSGKPKGFTIIFIQSILICGQASLSRVTLRHEFESCCAATGNSKINQKMCARYVPFFCYWFRQPKGDLRKDPAHAKDIVWFIILPLHYVLKATTESNLFGAMFIFWGICSENPRCHVLKPQTKTCLNHISETLIVNG